MPLEKIYKSESAMGSAFANQMRLKGFAVRKVDDRWGGLPDYLFSFCGGNELIELKMVEHDMPFTDIKHSKLRPSQVRFFRTWPGRAYYLAQNTVNGKFWMGCSTYPIAWWEEPGVKGVAETLLSFAQCRHDPIWRQDKTAHWLPPFNGVS